MVGALIVAMALAVKLGSFIANTSTGNQQITGVGFQPKVVLFWGNDRTGDGTEADANFHFGVGISSTERRSFGVESQDAVATSAVGNGRNNARCIRILNAAGTLAAQADFVSVDSDSFTINWTTAGAVGRTVHYLALGGDDLTNAALFSRTVPTTAGPEQVSGIGFRPDWVLFFAPSVSINENTLGQGSTSVQLGSAARIFEPQAWHDWSDDLGGIDNEAQTCRSVHNVNPSDTWRRYVSTRCIHAVGSGGLFYSAFMDSFDSDGFTLDWTTAGSSAWFYYLLAIKGPSFDQSNITQPSTTGQRFFEAGLKGKALLMWSAQSDVHNSTVAEARMMFGAATSPSNRIACWMGDKDNVSNTQADQEQDSTTIIKMSDPTSGSPSLLAAADFVEFSGQWLDFTIDWTTVDSVERRVSYLVIGDAQVIQDEGIPVESLVTAQQEVALPWEALSSVISDRLSLWESIGWVFGDHEVPWESLGNVTNDAEIPSEWLVDLLRDAGLPWESLGIVASDRELPWESTVPVGINRLIAWESVGFRIRAAFLWRMELRDRDFHLVDIFEPDQEASGIAWEYRRIGGCGTMRFRLARPYDRKGNIDGTYDVRLVISNPVTGELELWYRGFIQQIAPSLDDPESIDVICAGYGAQLGWIRISKTYSSQEAMEAVVTDIVQNVVAPNTKILFDAALIQATGVSLQAGEQLTFDTTADRALQTVTDIVGTREWGVGTDRTFFFKVREEAIKHRYHPGHDIARFEDFIDYSQIRNRLHLKGGGDPPFTAMREDTGSQTSWGLREEIITNTSIASNPTGNNYLNALLAAKAIPVRRSMLELYPQRLRLERQMPVGRIAVVGGVFTNKYGTFKYGAEKYGGEFGYQLQVARYRLDDNGIEVSMDLSQERPSIAEQVGRIEFAIDQLQQAR